MICSLLVVRCWLLLFGRRVLFVDCRLYFVVACRCVGVVVGCRCRYLLFVVVCLVIDECCLSCFVLRCLLMVVCCLLVVVYCRRSLLLVGC